MFKFQFARFVSRVLSKAGSLLGKGTDSPGRIALKLDPDLLRQFQFKGKIIAVTGSNGKTTTANLIAHILRKNGYSVINNAIGSNMTGGAATLLLNNCRRNGQVDADFVVLEVDERFSRFVFKDICPDYFLILNLLRDQVVRNGHPWLVLSKIEEAVHDDTVLILNANDPISQTIKGGKRRVFFAMDKTSRSTAECVSGTQDSRACPYCFHPMSYDYYHYNDLGKFHCGHCGYKTPDADYFGTDVNFFERSISINGQLFSTPFDTTYNMFNTVAAAAVCGTAGLTMEQTAEGQKDFKVAKERFDTFPLKWNKERTATLLLTKQNAASLDQSISYTLQQPGEKTVVLYVNNVLYHDYKDISWLYDVSFQRLAGNVDHIVCTGNRAEDTAVCLKCAGIPVSELLWETDLKAVPKAVDQTKGHVYVLSASAFGDEGKILEVLK